MIKAVKDFYYKIINFGDALQPYLLLAMRLAWGYFFFSAGYYKMTHLSEAAANFSNNGIPMAEINVALVGAIELIGGIFLFLGLAARLAAIPLIIIMLVALLTVHSAAFWNMWNDPNLFITQGPFTYLLTCLVILAFGPGPISVDYLLGRLVK